MSWAHERLADLKHFHDHEDGTQMFCIGYCAVLEGIEDADNEKVLPEGDGEVSNRIYKINNRHGLGIGFINDDMIERYRTFHSMGHFILNFFCDLKYDIYNEDVNENDLEHGEVDLTTMSKAHDEAIDTTYDILSDLIDAADAHEFAEKCASLSPVD